MVMAQSTAGDVPAPLVVPWPSGVVWPGWGVSRDTDSIRCDGPGYHIPGQSGFCRSWCGFRQHESGRRTPAMVFVELRT